MRQYIGARYVPRFTGLYDVTQAYEALDVVDNGSGTSYIAKKPTPAGIPLTNSTYWFLYGSTSGAIINLQQQIGHLDDLTTTDKTDLVSAINELVGADADILEQVDTSRYIMKSTGDTTDRTLELETALTTHNVIQFESGQFYIAGNVALPDNSKLIGDGSSSQIIMTNTSGSLFICGDNTEISSLKFYGGLDSRPSGINGTCKALEITGETHPIKIHNCNFFGFDHSGIYVHDMGWADLTSLEIVDCYFRHNAVGLNFAEHGEYALVTNCAFYQNYIGSLIDGGNNYFNNCEFSRNLYGIRIAPNNADNNGHGIINGCSFNHNSGIGIDIRNTPNGYIITGCTMFLNDNNAIYANNCTGGVTISDCLIKGSGQAPPVIDVQGSSLIELINNTFISTASPTLNVAVTATVKGMGNMFSNGVKAGSANYHMDPFGNETVAKTYETNSVVTEASFNNISAVIKGGTLFVNGNFGVEATNNDFTLIGRLTLPGNLPADINVNLMALNGDVAWFRISQNGAVFLYYPTTAGTPGALRPALAIALS